MSVIAIIVVLAVQGAIIGALARLALPGRDPMSPLQTIGVGLAGSLVAGLLVYAVGGEGPAPFLVAFIISFGIVYLIRRRRGGGLTHPGGTGSGSRERAER